MVSIEQTAVVGAAFRHHKRLVKSLKGSDYPHNKGEEDRRRHHGQRAMAELRENIPPVNFYCLVKRAGYALQTCQEYDHVCADIPYSHQRERRDYAAPGVNPLLGRNSGCPDYGVKKPPGRVKQPFPEKSVGDNRHYGREVYNRTVKLDASKPVRVQQQGNKKRANEV